MPIRRTVSALLVGLLGACAPGHDSERPPLGPGDEPMDVTAAPMGGKADGFDWGTGCGAGSGSFTQHVLQRTVVTVGTIPAGKTNVVIELESDADVDLQLYDVDGTEVIHWPDGILSGAREETTTYAGLEITYSGYQGDGTRYGHERVELRGVTPNAFVMKAYGYRAGDAQVSYRWDTTADCDGGGSGSFQQYVPRRDVVEVGTIPAGLNDVRIDLTSAVDIDIQLYDADGTEVVHWPDGLLSGAEEQSTEYGGVTVRWSGYQGDGSGSGNEFVELQGETQNDFVLKVYGYEEGEATVEYRWSRPGSGEQSACTLAEASAGCDLCEVLGWYGDAYCDDPVCGRDDPDCDRCNYDPCLGLGHVSCVVRPHRCGWDPDTETCTSNRLVDPCRALDASVCRGKAGCVLIEGDLGRECKYIGTPSTDPCTSGTDAPSCTALHPGCAWMDLGTGPGCFFLDGDGDGTADGDVCSAHPDADTCLDHEGCGWGTDPSLGRMICFFVGSLYHTLSPCDADTPEECFADDRACQWDWDRHPALRCYYGEEPECLDDPRVPIGTPPG